MYHFGLFLLRTNACCQSSGGNGGASSGVSERNFFSPPEGPSSSSSILLRLLSLPFISDSTSFHERSFVHSTRPPEEAGEGGGEPCLAAGENIQRCDVILGAVLSSAFVFL